MARRGTVEPDGSGKAKLSLAVIGRTGGTPRVLTTGSKPPRYIDWGTHP